MIVGNDLYYVNERHQGNWKDSKCKREDGANRRALCVDFKPCQTTIHECEVRPSVTSSDTDNQGASDRVRKACGEYGNANLENWFHLLGIAVRVKKEVSKGGDRHGASMLQKSIQLVFMQIQVN